uniref:Receptor protein kinase-like protein n=1 Tax=Oryza sativa subsp. japonica TaxID=39947 RepID=Q84YL0_ORYSJ|nr:receptor protein kinase-like protein [Oryza sativa Japonica Group]
MPLVALLLISSPKLLAAQQQLPFCSSSSSNANTLAYMAEGTYKTNLLNLAKDLIANVTKTGSHSAAGATAGTTGPDIVYGAVLCRGDSTNCSSRLQRVLDTASISNNGSTSSESDSQSQSHKSTVTLYDHEFQALLSFSDTDFISSFSNAPACIVSNYLNPAVPQRDADRTRFSELFSELMERISDAMVSSRASYLTGKGKGWFDGQESQPVVYGLAQCMDGMPPERCRSCLGGITDQGKEMVSNGLTEGMVLGVRCSLWYHYQTDGEFFAGEPGVLAFLNMPSSRDESKFGLWATIGSFFLMVSFSCFFVYIWIKQERKREARFKLRLISMAIQNVINLWRIEEGNSGFSLYNFSQIKEATQDFSRENKIGQGGFGSVYKGLLPGGLEVAVKRLSACSVQDFVKGAQLTWSKRLHIIDGIAQGILYLHNYSRLCVVHRDLKASNILLDSDMTPKISDFGMARIFYSNTIESNTTRIVGTLGYISPEYIFDGVCSIKSDVFSFGVLVLEIISGKRTSGFYPYDGKLYNLISYAWLLWRSGQGHELICCCIENNHESIQRCIQVALLCVQERADDRPCIDQVVTMLNSEGMTLPGPNQPAYFYVRSSGSSDVLSCDSNISITLER